MANGDDERTGMIGLVILSGRVVGLPRCRTRRGTTVKTCAITLETDAGTVEIQTESDAPGAISLYTALSALTPRVPVLVVAELRRQTWQTGAGQPRQRFDFIVRAIASPDPPRRDELAQRAAQDWTRIRAALLQLHGRELLESALTLLGNGEPEDGRA